MSTKKLRYLQPEIEIGKSNLYFITQNIAVFDKRGVIYFAKKLFNNSSNIPS